MPDPYRVAEKAMETQQAKNTTDEELLMQLSLLVDQFKVSTKTADFTVLFGAINGVQNAILMRTLARMERKLEEMELNIQRMSAHITPPSPPPDSRPPDLNDVLNDLERAKQETTR